MSPIDTFAGCFVVPAFETLWREAEIALAARPTKDGESEDDTIRLLHKLQVHQVELEMLNGVMRELQAKGEAVLRRLSMALRAARAGCWDWDVMSGRWTWSPEVFPVYGLDAASVEAGIDSWRAVLHPEDRDLAISGFVEALAMRRPLSMEYRILTASGDVRWILERGDICGGEGDSFCVMTGVAIDITEQKENAIELDRYRFRLEELVGERTAELAAAKAAAETASIAKSAFLANMSHEIRTPLNAISGAIYMIRRDGLTPAQAERVDMLEAASEHLLGLIAAILDLSKIEAGKFDLEEVPFRVDTLVGNVASLIQEKAHARDLRVLIDVKGLTSSFLGDAMRIQQALLNYAANAVKFTETGSIVLRARCIRHQGRRSLLRFEVEDSGIGVDAAALPRLFRPFEQANASMTRRYGGSGLGLAITRKIACLMDGDAGADSTPGVGSRFWFTVWLASAEPGAVLAYRKFGVAGELLRANYAGTRVLLVEDEPINRNVLASMLADVGLRVDLACDGLEAVVRAT
ncbi:PAS domain-containing hybrid sensor histidine kinase/response regulator [Propionivibrio dicarboxylicus]|uniref:Virulence sensor protein BvgS n=1 Tax=Propionivibrio dicarboxylicus TaxID=83767 RepID=A0A1G8JAM9_9RHOO|nr:PAS domain-containing hybrid sensor histidine kinase/response regulator [Propionivibrio dicarboxylicus]SDI28328.1 Signal transduction histidine kinase [Propionivibrio dicarboxylicus]